MLKVLQNPKTQKYLEFKNYILHSDHFPWYYKLRATPNINVEKGYIDVDYFTHTFLNRPEKKGYPISYSDFTEIVVEICKEIMDFNNISLVTLLRLNANFLNPFFKTLNTLPHFDHDYKHKNMLIYLTGSGGNTIVEGEVHEPQEDDVIIFQGKHYAQTPISERRVVLVGTFIDRETVN